MTRALAPLARRTGSLIAGLAVASGLAATPAMALADEVNLAMIEITGTPGERPDPFAWISGEEPDTVLNLVETFDAVAADDEFQGLVIRLKDAALGMTQVEELGRALDRVRDAGKKVHIFAENYGNTDLLFGAHADEVILQQGGGVSFSGLHVEEMYLADMFDWAGVSPTFVQVGDYKGASEQMMRAGPSDQWSTTMDNLLDGLYANMKGTLLTGRGLEGNDAERALEAAWWADGKRAIDVGLIDSEVDLPVLREHLAEVYGVDTVKWVKDPYESADSGGLDFSNPFALLGRLSEAPTQRIVGPSIGVLHVGGTIIDGDSSSGGMFGGGESVGSRTIRNAIEQMLKEDDIKGVVVRIDSPGGSAIASEVMWLGLDRLKAEKPVWVSVAGMAASGGYYVLSAGDKVYVNPSSIVGSIGVVGGKVAYGGLLDKVKVHTYERSRGPNAEMMSSLEPWSQTEMAMVRQRMRETYDLFTQRVRAGREDIDLSVAGEGRIFTGRQAIELGMADKLGGLDDAVNDLAFELGLDNFDVVEYPGSQSFEDFLGTALGGFLQAPGLKSNALANLGSTGELTTMLRTTLGEQRFAAMADGLRMVELLRDERVLAIMPRVLITR